MTADSSFLASVAAWLFRGTRYMFYLVDPKEFALSSTDEPISKQIFVFYGLPMFFVLILFEFVFIAIANAMKSKAEDKFNQYRLYDAVAGLAAGAVQLIGIVGVQWMGVFVGAEVYRYVWDELGNSGMRLEEMPVKEYPWTTFIFVMLYVDHGYYWYHRFLHEYHVGWASHSVHHSGEDYNLGMALRQGVLQPVFQPPFYCTMALLGIPPQTFGAHKTVNTLVMFWFHTDLIGRLPFPLEYIINTPMAHRMHHRPPGNCNYGGLLVIWDRIYGTYRAEAVRKDFYGLGNQPQSFDPVTIQMSHYNYMNKISGGFLGNLFARRVRWRWIFDPLAVFRPIKPQKGDDRKLGPQRKKWEPKHPLSNLAVVAQLISGVLTLVVNMGLALKNGSSSLVPLIVMIGIVAASWTGKASDNLSGNCWWYIAGCVLATAVNLSIDRLATAADKPVL